jgi:hypothetical protein
MNEQLRYTPFPDAGRFRAVVAYWRGARWNAPRGLGETSSKGAEFDVLHVPIAAWFPPPQDVPADVGLPRVFALMDGCPDWHGAAVVELWDACTAGLVLHYRVVPAEEADAAEDQLCFDLWDGVVEPAGRWPPELASTAG